MKALYKFTLTIIVCTIVFVSCSDNFGNNGTTKGYHANNKQDLDNIVLLNTTSNGYFSGEMQLELVSALNEYIATDSVSKELLQMHGDADTVKPIPVLGTYLENTNLVMYLFYKNDTLCSSATLEFDSNGEPVNVKLAEFASDSSSEYSYLEVFSNQDCFDAVKSCLSVAPDFEILGVVYSNSGYPMVLPIGRCKGETTIKYFLNEPLNFDLVEPFNSIEEGQVLFALYWAEKNHIESHLPIYSWKKEDFYELGYWNMYKLDFIYDDSVEYREKLLPLIEHYDSLIAIPLLNPSFEENRIISHLLYRKNQLIGEVVLSLSFDEQGNINVATIYANISQKKEDGSYIPMSVSEYQKVIETAKINFPNMEIEGVIFDKGQYIPFAYEEGSIVYLVG